VLTPEDIEALAMERLVQVLHQLRRNTETDLEFRDRGVSAILRKAKTGLQGAPPRTAGNLVTWQGPLNGAVYRTRRLPRERALKILRVIRRPTNGEEPAPVGDLINPDWRPRRSH
jgi:hypothetical protein